MKKSLRLPPVVVCIVLTAAAITKSFATDVFVTTSAQLTTACNNALPGDVIKIKAGTYAGSFSLINKSNVILKAKGGAVFLQGNPDPNTNGYTILSIKNSSNITVDGLRFTENWGNG